MEYVVPVLSVLVIGALTMAAVRWLSAGRRGGARPAGAAAPGPSALGGLEVGVDRARQASARLTEAAHRAVYGHIAQGRALDALHAYREHTGRGRRDSLLDVQALAAHPQVYTLPMEQELPADDAGPHPAPQPAPDAVEPGHGPGPAPQAPLPSGESGAEPVPADRAGAAGPQDEAVRRDGSARREEVGAGEPVAGETGEGAGAEALTVPAEWSAAPAPEDRPFEVDVVRGADSVHISSRDLPPWLRDQLSAMVRDGNLESAAVQLAGHSELSVPEAFELLKELRARREGRTD
ncbi:hypothetical protein [Micrococcus sp.]|uniref:hypothetical protein n=1 Tax=Micrococcus sp. TaxID=1271 RepID=UPI002A90EB83|nr:hypothetical protein [Micrococcus sp.]MDY6055178.1 hypothetical protein [Micrococcus sp.]